MPEKLYRVTGYKKYSKTAAVAVSPFLRQFFPIETIIEKIDNCKVVEYQNEIEVRTIPLLKACSKKAKEKIISRLSPKEIVRLKKENKI